MTDISTVTNIEPNAATTLIDAFLTDTRHHSLIDADRVHDFLLDLRLSLAA